MKQLLCAVFLLAAAARASGDEQPKVDFRDGDRVVFIGNDFFDRDRDRGYIETQLTTRFPEKNLTFRNLGYSGDTVRADARNLCSGWAVFGPEDQGFDRLRNLVEHIKPTLIFIAYGMNESFDGEQGIQPFVQGLNRMLDMVVSSSGPGARLVLVSPIRHEDLGRPLPDPAAHNKNIKLYVDAIHNVASGRKAAFVDLFEALGDGASDPLHHPFTSDGIHLTPYGYWRAAMVLEKLVGYPPRTWNNPPVSPGVAWSPNGTSSALLPLAPPPEGSPQSLLDGTAFLPGQAPIVRSTGLAPGTYVLKSGDQTVASGTAEQWAKGIAVLHGPAVDQEEELRKTIVAKNFDFFNFWRPDNDTYIFGYRKREQGRNAVEIPRFEPLVEAKEAEIAKLRVPASHTYTLAREAAK